MYYLHAPDTRVPVVETLEGIDALYKSGAFRRFGISNFDADQTNEVLRICRERGFVLPTVYQGNYNAVARLAETELFPILRENNSKCRPSRSAKQQHNCAFRNSTQVLLPRWLSYHYGCDMSAP